MVYDSDGRERLLTGHTGRLFLTLTLVLVLIRLGQRLLPPLLPVIIDDLGITAFLAGVALTLQRIARASMEYPSGRLADQLSRTTVLLACLGFVIVGFAVLSAAFTYAVFLLGVTSLGMGLGLYSSASRALLSDVFHEKRGRAFGFHMMGSDLSGILAASIAIFVAPILTWQGVFFPLFLILLPFPLLFYSLSREPVRVERVDLGLRKTGGRLLGDPSIRWLLVVYSLYVLASSGVTSFLPVFLIEVHGFSFAFANSAFALLYGAGFLAKPTGGVVSDRVSRPIVGGCSLLVGCLGLAALVLAPSKAAAIAGVLLYAFGQRAVPPALQAFLMDRFADDSMGSDLGAMRTVYMTVGSLGPGITGLIASTLGYVPAFVGVLGLFLLSCGILFWFSAVGWPSPSRT